MADVAQRQLVIQPARRVYGTLQVPGDKSIAHRYAMLGAIAEGTTDIAHLAPGEDVATSLACMQALGATIERRGPLAVRVTGCGARGLAAATAPLDAGNSGTTIRLLAGIVASYPIITVMHGDASLSRRPMTRVIEPLSAMGATIRSNNGRAPLEIHGGRLISRHGEGEMVSIYFAARQLRDTAILHQSKTVESGSLCLQVKAYVADLLHVIARVAWKRCGPASIKVVGQCWRKQHCEKTKYPESGLHVSNLLIPRLHPILIKAHVLDRLTLGLKETISHMYAPIRRLYHAWVMILVIHIAIGTPV